MTTDTSSPAPVAAGPNLRADLVSGFLVFLIALPLCLGISMASGFPAVSGILTAVVGGLLATFFGSAPLTIKGPAAGLIVIALGAVQELGAGDTQKGYRQALAAIVAAAALQIVFALLKAGKLGDFFPGAVVHGMLAAIGVIIVSKQAHVLMGVTPQGKEPLHLLAEIPHSLTTLDPEVFTVGLVSLAILFGLPRLPFGWAKRVPAPMVVLMAAMPLGLYFDLEHEHTYTFAHHEYQIGPKYLVSLPGNLVKAMVTPDFSAVFSGTSIKYIVMFALVGSIESLLSAKAVDALDPRRRVSDLNKDLLATGLGNLVAGMLGGLPMISEIVRSSANINNGATSRRSNFFHGLFLLLFVALLPNLLHRIPLAALAAMLIYTGLRLASPTEFMHTYKIGPEQLVVFLTTLFVTLATDLLVGVGVGLVVKAVIHLKNGASLMSLLKANVEASGGVAGEAARLRVRGAAVFTNYLGLRKHIDGLKGKVKSLELDMSETCLVDHTVITGLEDLKGQWSREGRELRIVGLDRHTPMSTHPYAARLRRTGAVA